MSDSKKELPSWWVEDTFDLLFRNVTSSKLKIQQKHYKRFGKYPVIDQGQDLIGGYTDNEKLLHPNMPPLIVFGDHTRCLKFIDFRFTQGADGVKVLEPRELMDPKYCYFALKQTSLPDKGYSRHFKFLKNSIIPIPPLKEQKRLVDKIEELQARSRRAREVLETIPDLLEQLRQSILAAAFRGDLTKEWRESHPNVEPATELMKRIRVERRKRWEDAELEKLKAKGLSEEKLKEAFANSRKQYKEPSQVDITDLPELPEGWCWVSIEEVSSLVTKGSSPNWQGFDYVPKGIPFVRSQNVLSGKLDLSEITFLPESFNVKERKSILMADDVLANIVGASIGRAALVERQVIGGNVNQAVAVIRLIPKGLMPALLVDFLLSPKGQSQIHGGKVEVARANLSLSDVAGMAVPLPPIKEQNELIICLNRAIEVQTNIYNALGKLEILSANLDQSILSKAFRGELVPQDPNDEPASILLERIRQEKAHEVADPKAKDKRKGKKMHHKQEAQRDIFAVLRKSGKALTPEEVFSAAGFDEASVDIFYEQLRATMSSKHVREIKEGNTILLEAIVP